jgi:hypothetical protein
LRQITSSEYTFNEHVIDRLRNIRENYLCQEHL